MNTKETLNKSFLVADNMTEKIWDMWMVSLGSITWTQEQAENAMRKYLDQRKLTREESTKFLEEMMNQVKKNQIQMQSMIEEAVKTAFENVKVPSLNCIDELSKKVDDLAKKVDQQ